MQELLAGQMSLFFSIAGCVSPHWGGRFLVVFLTQGSYFSDLAIMVRVVKLLRRVTLTCPLFREWRHQHEQTWLAGRRKNLIRAAELLRFAATSQHELVYDWDRPHVWNRFLESRKVLPLPLCV
jgi:hypothetical protein